MKSWSVALTGLLGLLALLASSSADSGLELAVNILLIALFGFGWPHYLAIPARKTLGLVIAVSGSFSAIVANFTPGPSYLLWVAPIIAIGIGAIFVVQLIRGTGQSHRLESTFGGVVGVLVASIGSAWIAAHRFSADGSLTLIAGTSAAVVLLLSMISWPDRIIAPLGLALGTLAGPLVALALSQMTIVPAAVIGFVVAAILLSFRRLSHIAPAQHSIPGGIAVGLASVLSLGGVVYFIDKMLMS